jgi:cephalosporin hydroxylase
VEIRPHNRKAIESHELAGQIELVEGSSTDPGVVAKVRALVRPGDRVLVLLDSNHSKNHVLGELRAYGDLVTVGSYIVACDGIMKDVVGAPRTNPDWTWNNPRSAVEEFLRERKDFVAEEVPFVFNEGHIHQPVTYWPGGYLRRIS